MLIDIFNFLFTTYIFLFPIIMGVIWIVGSIYFWWSTERKIRWHPDKFKRKWPHITILVPCYNEETVIADTCKNLTRLNYPRYEVLFVDDFSTDGTVNILMEWATKIPHFDLLKLPKNIGKAAALNEGLLRVKSSIVVTIDADTHLDSATLKWFCLPFVAVKRTGAVTANIVPRNRHGFLPWFQVAEFASIVGLIRRCQRIWGRALTVSGCATAYRTRALRRVGGFCSQTATEDIDITWRLQRKSYRIWFLPPAVAHIMVPVTFGQLWRQRCRWALGGWHLLRMHWGVFKETKSWMLWPVYIEFALGYLWGVCFVIGLLLWLLGNPLGFSPLLAWHGAIISVVCIVQMCTGLSLNSRYDKQGFKSFLLAPWYPLLLYCLMALATAKTLPRGLFESLNNDNATWKGPRTEKERKGND